MNPSGRRAQLFLCFGLAVLALFIGCGKSSGGGGKRKGVPVATVNFPMGGTFIGDVDVRYNISDPQSDPSSIQVFYQVGPSGKFKPATESLDPLSEGTSNLSTAPSPGIPHVFIWDSYTDLGAVNVWNVVIKVHPSDPFPGKPDLSGPITIDNRSLKPLEVTGVTDGMFNSVFDRLEITFSKELDTTTVIHQGTTSDTLAVYQDRNTIPGGPFDLQSGTISFSAGDTVVTYSPPSPFIRFREIRIVLTSQIGDTTGRVLEQGPAFPSDTLSFTGTFPDQVFEFRFLPGVGRLQGLYKPDSTADLWYLDFESYGTLDGDLGRHGLRGSDPLVAAYSRDLTIGQILYTTSDKYLREPSDGSAKTGAYRISFVGVPPPGTVRFDYSRMCLGLDVGSLWGRAWLDPGNQFKEDDCDPGLPLGVFTGSIYGLNSYLSPGLGPTDLPYVDGSYVLGTGTSEDARFLRVRNVVGDWGHSLAIVTAHEVGHSVGLFHNNSSNLNIMRGWASPDHVSNPNTRFGSASTSLLRANLGVVP